MSLNKNFDIIFIVNDYKNKKEKESAMAMIKRTGIYEYLGKEMEMDFEFKDTTSEEEMYAELWKKSIEIIVHLMNVRFAD